ncbi:19711_t:CDS:2 [Gigaspora margarita]|uniref:19711_t:CDS:1 n=1 Tax=Gigaspora margarita TaxID=4874 RepID=A0ABN7UR02_GIGMA|nr:19711_t:CDS:2 [Gigaspora margarita]
MSILNINSEDELPEDWFEQPRSLNDDDNYQEVVESLLGTVALNLNEQEIANNELETQNSNSEFAKVATDDEFEMQQIMMQIMN